MGMYIYERGEFGWYKEYHGLIKKKNQLKHFKTGRDCPRFIYNSKLGKFLKIMYLGWVTVNSPVYQKLLSYTIWGNYLNLENLGSSFPSHLRMESLQQGTKLIHPKNIPTSNE